MIDKKGFKGILYVTFSNIIKMLVSILTIFILPLVFSKQNYGYYKLFFLYLSYVGVLHFGLIDGIYLIYSGKKREELSPTKFSYYFKLLLIIQIIILIIILGYSGIVTGEKKNILVFISVNTLIVNLMGFFQFLSQITENFSEYANRNLILSILNFIFLIIFFILRIDSYIFFLIVYTLINGLMLLWYIFTYKKLILVKNNKIDNINLNLKETFKLGIPLLLSNLVIIMMSNISKQIVEIIYPIEIYPDTFAIFSFAFTLLGYTSVFLAAISIIIYPILKRTEDDKLKNNYSKLSNILIVILTFSMLGYYPVKLIIEKFLPGYTESLLIFFIICPSIIFTSIITIVQQNYYKRYNLNTSFLVIGISLIILLTITTLITSFYISSSLIIISIIYLLFIILWYVINEIYLIRKLNIKISKNYLYLIVNVLSFYLFGTLFSKMYISISFYFLVFLISTLLFNVSKIKNYLAEELGK